MADNKILSSAEALKEQKCPACGGSMSFDPASGKLVCDLLHTEGAEAISNYEEDFYAGMPALTRNSFGQGQAWYVATASSDDFYDALVKKLCTEGNVLPLYDSFRPDTEDRTTRAETAGTGADSADESPDPWNGIEVTVRETAEEKILFFLTGKSRCILFCVQFKGLVQVKFRYIHTGIDFPILRIHKKNGYSVCLFFFHHLLGSLLYIFLDTGIKTDPKILSCHRFFSFFSFICKLYSPGICSGQDLSVFPF